MLDAISIGTRRLATRPAMQRAMQRTMRLAVLLCVVGWFGPHTCHGAPRVEAELSRERVYEGDAVVYRVALIDGDDAATPELAATTDFDVRLRGSSANSSVTVIIGNQRQNLTERRNVFEYVLTPRKTGTLAAPVASVSVGTQRYRGPTLTLEVLAAAEQDVVHLKLDVQPPSVYPRQPFRVVLTAAIRALPDQAADTDPTTVQDQPPQLTIPWFDDDQLPGGVTPRVPAARLLEPLLHRAGGFRINGQPSSPLDQMRRSFGGLFSDPFFDRLDDRGIRPQPTRTTRSLASGSRGEYWEYAFEREFVADQVGPIEFGPVSLRGMFGTRSDTRGRLEGEEIYAAAKAVSVTIKDVPAVGRPPEYTGAIGQFQLAASLAPTDVRVGEPLTLTLTLTGAGTLDRTLPPDLAAVPAVASSFRVYDATSATHDDRRTFTYSLRAKAADATEFPGVTLAYFDVAAEQFKLLRTAPIPLRIAAAEQLPASELAVAAPAPSADSAKTLAARSEGIFANVTDARELRDETVRVDRCVGLLGGLLLTFALTAAISRRRQRRCDAAGRRRTAAERARQRLQQAREGLDSGDQRRAAELLNEALIGLIADRHQVPAAGLTSADALRLLAAAGAAPQQQQQFNAVFQALDAARFGGRTETLRDLAEQAARLAEEQPRAV